MNKYRRGNDRDELLADIAEMYYDGDMTQSVISRVVGVTRSAVSRMLTEARGKGIVEIRVNRPLRFDHTMEQELVSRFGLKQALVLSWKHTDQYDDLRKRLGAAAAGSGCRSSPPRRGSRSRRRSAWCRSGAPLDPRRDRIAVACNRP